MLQVFPNFVFLALAASSLNGMAGNPRIYHFDVRKPAGPVKPSQLKVGTTKNPAGHQITLNSSYFLRDGRPWLPVMGEIHYTRQPRPLWNEALRKMKAGGVEVISTYVIWNHHEEIEGQWDWGGNRSLRAFLEACARQDLYVVLRVGPWAHGGARNGGYPDWLLKKGLKLHSNDPAYLKYARRVYEEIYGQTRGLFFKDGGPVIGAQIENELVDNPDHLLTLKRMAQEIGFDVPFYTATAWMSARLPKDEFLPVWAAYADEPWEKNAPAPVPPRKQYLFSGPLDLFTGNPDAPGAGLDLNRTTSGVPFATAEIGNGQINARRRPAPTARDTAALAYVALGKGANLLGYYLYHGAIQPEGSMGLEETGMPKRSYDCWAPISEFGQTRDSYHYLRQLHLLVKNFPELATLGPHLPSEIPAEPRDAAVLRSIVRSNGGAGFLFWSNHHRGVQMQNLGPLQFRVRLNNREITIPAKPAMIRQNTFGIWPFNLSLEGAVLQYATLQPLVRIDNTYFFAASEGVAPEFVFDTKTTRKVETNCRADESGLSPGTTCTVSVSTATGKIIQLVALTAEQGRQFWTARVGGRDHAFLSDADLQFEGDTILADSADSERISIAAFPALNMEGASGTKDGVFTRYEQTLTAKKINVVAQPRSPGSWTIKFSQDVLDGLADVMLEIPFTGNAASLYSSDGRRLLADQFYSGGRVWTVGLKRLPSEVLTAGAVLEVTPLKKDAPIFLERRPTMSRDSVLELLPLGAIPVYRGVFRSRTVDSLPLFRHHSVVLDYKDLRYNPADDVIVPSVIRADKYFKRPLGRYYMYYAPHDGPAGICLAFADKLEGPWKEYDSNPLIANKWTPYYRVSHVSGADAIWNEEAGKLFLYFHGENDTTRFASSDDGIHFTYEGVAVTTQMFDSISEASYARIFRHALPGKSNRYIMMLMGNNKGTRRIYLAWSTDGRKWETRRTPLIDPPPGTSQVAQAWYFPWKGKDYVFYHAHLEANPNIADLRISEIDKAFDHPKYLGMLYEHTSASPTNLAQMSPCLVTEGNTLYLFTNVGPRLHQKIALAVAEVE